MIWILTTVPILLRRLQCWIAVLRVEGKTTGFTVLSWVSSSSKITCCSVLSIDLSAFHSWEDQALSSSHLEQRAEYEQATNCLWWCIDSWLASRPTTGFSVLSYAFLSSKVYNVASLREEFTFEEVKSTLSGSSIFPWDFFRIWSLRSAPRTRFVHGYSPVLCYSVSCFRELRRSDSHKSSAGIPSNLNPASKEMIFWFCLTVRSWSLFLTHPTYWNKCMTSKNCTMFTPEVDLESSRTPAKSESWKQSQPALFSSITDITILFVFTCVMNVRYQPIQAFFHKLCSILWWILQVCSLNIEYQVFQSVPSISISEQFESIHVKILQQISLLPL